MACKEVALLDLGWTRVFRKFESSRRKGSATCEDTNLKGKKGKHQLKGRGGSQQGGDREVRHIFLGGEREKQQQREGAHPLLAPQNRGGQSIFKGEKTSAPAVESSHPYRGGGDQKDRGDDKGKRKVIEPKAT